MDRRAFLCGLAVAPFIPPHLSKGPTIYAKLGDDITAVTTMTVDPLTGVLQAGKWVRFTGVSLKVIEVFDDSPPLYL